jgi:hypothetical protein
MRGAKKRGMKSGGKLALLAYMGFVMSLQAPAKNSEQSIFENERTLRAVLLKGSLMDACIIVFHPLGYKMTKDKSEVS